MGFVRINNTISDSIRFFSLINWNANEINSKNKKIMYLKFLFCCWRMCVYTGLALKYTFWTTETFRNLLYYLSFGLKIHKNELFFLCCIANPINHDHHHILHHIYNTQYTFEQFLRESLSPANLLTNNFSSSFYQCV